MGAKKLYLQPRESYLLFVIAMLVASIASRGGYVGSSLGLTPIG